MVSSPGYVILVVSMCESFGPTSTPHGGAQGSRFRSNSGSDVTAFAPQKALKLVVCYRLTFDVWSHSTV